MTRISYQSTGPSFASIEISLQITRVCTFLETVFFGNPEKEDPGPSPGPGPGSGPGVGPRSYFSLMPLFFSFVVMLS